MKGIFFEMLFAQSALFQIATDRVSSAVICPSKSSVNPSNFFSNVE